MFILLGCCGTKFERHFSSHQRLSRPEHNNPCLSALAAHGKFSVGFTMFRPFAIFSHFVLLVE
jgi:hypothetical protein